jgi:carboxyl-terminal processing protease
VKGRRILLLAAAVLAFGASFAVGFELRSRSLSAPAAVLRPTPVRTQVLEDLETHYYRALPPAAYHARTVAALLRSLGDPYTRYLRPSAYDVLRTAESGTYPGFGLALSREQHGLRVTASIPGLPGRRAGIRPGDLITTIDGASLASLSYRRALDLIGGRTGSPVHLRIVRTGRDQPISLTLVRRPIALPYVSSHVVGYEGMRVRIIRMRGFPATAGRSVRRYAELAHRRHQPVILDLRGNPGGLLSQAVDVVRVFVQRGVVVTTAGRHEPARQFVADHTAVGRLRIAVLIDGGTASAAEVVAGALRADAGAILVGQRSYGKGTVQAIESLPGGGALKLTVARFTVGAGLVVDGRGLRPSVPVRRWPHHPDSTVRAALAALAAPER